MLRKKKFRFLITEQGDLGPTPDSILYPDRPHKPVVSKPTPEPVPEPTPEPVPEPVPEPTPEPVPEPVPKKIKIRLIKMSPKKGLYKLRKDKDYGVPAMQDYMDNVPDYLGLHRVGNISVKGGGKWSKSPHKSHQTGVDVDWPVYIKGQTENRLQKFNPVNLDIDRTLDFLVYNASGDRAKSIYFDKKYNEILRKAAEKDWDLNVKEDHEMYKKIFGHKKKKGMLQHSPGHKDHMHVRLNTHGFKDKKTCKKKNDKWSCRPGSDGKIDPE
jgi:murein endopeptidase